MIYNGLKGYLSGDLSQPNDTVLAMTKGPVAGRNWFNFSVDPYYSISITAGASGTVALQGTNDVALMSDSGSELNPIEMDILPTEGATWTDIHAATSSSVTGTFNTTYQFLRLVIVATGTGTVTQAWVKWN